MPNPRRQRPQPTSKWTFVYEEDSDNDSDTSSSSSDCITRYTGELTGRNNIRIINDVEYYNLRFSNGRFVPCVWSKLEQVYTDNDWEITAAPEDEAYDWITSPE